MQRVEEGGAHRRRKQSNKQNRQSTGSDSGLGYGPSIISEALPKVPTLTNCHFHSVHILLLTFSQTFINMGLTFSSGPMGFNLTILYGPHLKWFESRRSGPNQSSILCYTLIIVEVYYNIERK